MSTETLIPDAVVSYWAQQGYYVGDGGDRLVNGMPETLDASVEREPIDLEFERMKAAGLRRLSLNQRIDELIATTSKKHGVTVDVIKNCVFLPRYKNAHARFEVWWVMNNEFDMSMLRIARRFRKHHTTVMHGIRRHAEMKGL